MLCEKCKKVHDGTFGSGRFCSRSCANSRIFSKETNIKKSIANKGKKFTKREIRRCKICQKEFECKITETRQVCYKKECWISPQYNHKKCEKKVKNKIEEYFKTEKLFPQKINNKWFDFVNQFYIIEYTTDVTAGVYDAIKRFEYILNETRQKFLICPQYKLGKLRRGKLKNLGVIIIDIGVIV